MGKYAVINPATGETVKEYPLISGEDLSARSRRQRTPTGTGH